MLGCECCDSDTSDDVYAFVGTIVNSCCWGKVVAAVAVIARTTVIFTASITAKFIAAVAVRVLGCKC